MKLNRVFCKSIAWEMASLWQCLAENLDWLGRHKGEELKRVREYVYKEQYIPASILLQISSCRKPQTVHCPLAVLGHLLLLANGCKFQLKNLILSPAFGHTASCSEWCIKIISITASHQWDSKTGFINYLQTWVSSLFRSTLMCEFAPVASQRPSVWKLIATINRPQYLSVYLAQPVNYIVRLS